MKKYRVAVCKGPHCKLGGAEGVLAAARSTVNAQGLGARCEIYRGGCYGLCHLGPNVVVREAVGRKRDALSREDFQLMGWEEEAYYGAVTPEKMKRIVTEHVGQDLRAADLLGDPDAPDAS